jgi:hypothetical protein
MLGKSMATEFSYGWDFICMNGDFNLPRSAEHSHLKCTNAPFEDSKKVHLQTIGSPTSTFKHTYRSPLTAAARREKQKHSAYRRYEEDYKTDDIHLVPWSKKRGIPLVAETRGGLRAHCRALINLCASPAESLLCPGYDPKLKAELSTKFTYSIVSAKWMNNAGMSVRISLNLLRDIQ